MTQSPNDSGKRLDVFFYGLFMDEALLKEKGVNPENRRLAAVENFKLIIGERATLVPASGETVHGVLFSLTQAEIDSLYAEPSVSEYRPEPVVARLRNGEAIPALCFNLPEPPSSSERNPHYAARLKELAGRIGLPAEYVATIT